MHQISLEKFEGPLDLLLQLIEKNQLQITEISLAQITDQYLDYIDSFDNLPSSEVADFLLIASKLIYLKSKYLLPDFNIADEDDAASLEEQLKIYRQYYEASKKVNRLFNNKKKYSHIRTVPYKRMMIKEFRPPANASPRILFSIFKEVVDRIEVVVNLPSRVMAKAMSISEKISSIRDLIKKNIKFSFGQILKEKGNKTEVVISFLAMLELAKQRELVIVQEEMFGNLDIKKYK